MVRSARAARASSALPDRGSARITTSAGSAADPTGEARRHRRRRRRGEVVPAEPALADGQAVEEAGEGEPRPARTRNRRRRVEGADALETVDSGPVVTAEAGEEGEARTARARTRRRRRGGRGRGGSDAAETTEGPAED
ncbi:hypothetical protein GCM10010532_019580 [Dactylosporangium siamense]